MRRKYDAFDRDFYMISGDSPLITHGQLVDWYNDNASVEMKGDTVNWG